MGGRVSRSRDGDAPGAVNTSKDKGDVVDISVQSTASHQGSRHGGSDAQLVLENILINEAEVDGKRAAVTAGLEALRSEELRDASAGAHSQAARALEQSRRGSRFWGEDRSRRSSRYGDEEWDPDARHADGSAHDGHLRRMASRMTTPNGSMHGSRHGGLPPPIEKETDPEGPPAGFGQRLLWHLRDYFLRMRGGLEDPAKVPPLLDIARGWFGAFLSILVIAALKQWATPEPHFDFLVASFGASAVLVFGACEGKLAQPYNLVGGQVVSAIVGVTVRHILWRVLWLSSAVGMAVALSVMQLLKCLHPPGGATALIAASAPNPIPVWAGYSIVLVVFIDSLVMLVIGLLVNNSWRGKRYPTYWW